ncbi:MAG: dienelactone hydrolase family protein [Bacteroidetes bacterium]|nr:dienelactone hydrolase family protein [Bacteroidota bacterium]MBS1539489.1 dienelactone hydrolase family protein [Bacteroidota bacterium]
MKKMMLFFMLGGVACAAWAQTDQTLCHTPATEKFALFASNKSFKKMHNLPLPYVHVSEAGGKMITFKTDGADANAYVLTAKNKTNNWIFVFQEWWGLNDHIKREAENLYNDLGNVNVLALDMYDGKVGATREEAGKYMQEFKQDRGNAIVKGALAYVGAEAKVGTIGWCFGGGQSMQAALTAGKQAVACVIYYGMPEENVERLKSLNCDVLDIWPTQDKWINKEVTEKFEKNMATAGKKLTVKPYDADHAFANPSNPKHSKEFTADAYRHTLSFFKSRLK